MIITRTPYRISFVGGGSDYPAWYNIHGGAVLSAAINKYCYVSVRETHEFSDYKFKAVYNRIEECNRVEDIQHPSIRECLKAIKSTGHEIHHDGDIPARTGMGTSSAFTVGLLRGLLPTIPSPAILAGMATHIEQDLIGECIGSQDQVAAAFGGVNLIRFNNKEFTVESLHANLTLQLDKLHQHLILVYIGSRKCHNSEIETEIAREQIETIPKRAMELTAMSKMPDIAVGLLESGDILGFGRLLDEAWEMKKSLSSRITTDEIDGIYNRAKLLGATGGKLLGAGGAGFMLLLAEPDKHRGIINKLGRKVLPFKFDTGGSRILYGRGYND